MIRFWLLLFATFASLAQADSPSNPARDFLRRHCSDCHAEGASEGGFEITQIGDDLHDEATFANWVRVHDRVRRGEMPPPDSDQPNDEEIKSFLTPVQRTLHRVHAATKATTLRRLNRREYENTLNDLFQTDLDLQSRLPEDGRSHEFDNVGDALGLSMVHLEQYLAAIEAVLDEVIHTTTGPVPVETLRVSYADTREGEKFIGNVWEQLDDGAVVFYADLGYPTGMLRDTAPKQAGRHKIRIEGYAYRSQDPITFRVGGTSFVAGSPKPTYGYFEFPPGDSTTIEFETWVDKSMMIEITPYGIDTGKYKLRNDGVAGYTGPGLAIAGVEVEGPLNDGFPRHGHRWLFDGIDRVEVEPRNPAVKSRSWYVPKFTVQSDSPIKDATPVIRRIAKRAFRRPVDDGDLQPYIDLFANQRESGEDFESSLRTAVAAIFCSPDFLYLHEPPGWLDDAAIANRLSYFLMRSSPDTALRQSAEKREIARNRDVLTGHAQRLIDGPHIDRFVVDFCDAWLNLRDLEFTSPDQQLYPEFDPYLLDSMAKETRAFFGHALRNNLPVQQLVRGDFAMLNERLASHYQIDGVDGPAIRRVELPVGHVRGGLLGHASILKVSANGTNTSPVVRGVWVTERLIGIHPPPPPPGIAGVEPDIRGASTLRELLDKHRDSDTCRSCHSVIDPPGFALENFNPIGGWRDRFRSLGSGDRVDLQINNRRVRYRLGPPVDSSGQTFDGTSFDGFEAFRDWLAADSDRLARTMITKWLTFATGREMGFSDRPVIDRLVQKSRTQDHRLRDMMDLVVTSEIFRRK